MVWALWFWALRSFGFWMFWGFAALGGFRVLGLLGFTALRFRIPEFGVRAIYLVAEFRSPKKCRLSVLQAIRVSQKV